MASIQRAASGSESDMEHGALLVGGLGSQRIRPRSLVSFGLLVALVVAIVWTLRLRKFPGSIEVQDGSAASRLGRLSGLVRAYAMERGGRALTDGDFEILYSRMDETRHPRARALTNQFSMDVSLGPNEQDDVELGLSGACANAIEAKLKEAVESFAKLLVDMLFGCVVPGKGSPCRAAEARIDSFPEDLAAQCQEDGDFCNITAIEMEGRKRADEAQTVCVPVACHKEAMKAIKFFGDQLGEQIERAKAGARAGMYSPEQEKNADDCGNCIVHIECGAGALAQDARQLADAERLAHM